MRKMSTNYLKLKDSNYFLMCSFVFFERLCLQGRVIHLGSLGMKEKSYMPSVENKGSMCSTLFFKKSRMWLSPTTSHVPMHPIS
jgi:hypothetical protein